MHSAPDLGCIAFPSLLLLPQAEAVTAALAPVVDGTARPPPAPRAAADGVVSIAPPPLGPPLGGGLPTALGEENSPNNVGDTSNVWLTSGAEGPEVFVQSRRRETMDDKTATFACSFCGRPNSNGALAAVGRCATCTAGDGDALCDRCFEMHSTKAIFKGHACVSHSSPPRGVHLLRRLGLEATPRACISHGGAPYVDVVCADCKGDYGDAAFAHNFCAHCVRDHLHAHPRHVLSACSSDAIALRARMTSATRSPVDGCGVALGPHLAVGTAAQRVISTSCDVGAASSMPPMTTCAERSSREAPLIACARHKAAAAADELALLMESYERALEQAAANRDTAVAAASQLYNEVTAEITAIVDAKRADLNAEVAAADKALHAAMDAVSILAEVRESLQMHGTCLLTSISLRCRQLWT